MGNKKYYGMIGFAMTVETDPINHPSVYENQIVEKAGVGDVIRTNVKNDNNNQVNDNITISTQISIVASPYVLQNLEHIVYATYLNVKWKVTSVQPNTPRLILNLGGVWNEQ
jgi:hypothetical protein